MQWRWCALHRILNTKQTASIVFKHGDGVHFIILNTASIVFRLNNKQFIITLIIEKNDGKQIMKLKSMNASCLFS